MERKIELAARIPFLKALPCFAFLSTEELYLLADLMQEKNYAPQQTLVNEDELVDSIFLIVAGQAEVKRRIKQRLHSDEVPIARLDAGESIGLNEAGFYSRTGFRTASVSALTPLMVLQLKVKDLHDFLQSHHLETAFYASAKQMMRIGFIKQSLPFATLSHERLTWLEKYVEEETIPAGSVLFNEGETADKCYLICSGKIEIVVNEKNEKHLATLRPPAFFGEAAFMTQAPRNATARAIEKTELLVLRHCYLSELMESEEKVAGMMEDLMMQRSRPLRHPQVSLHERKTADGHTLFILKNPANGNYFKLSAEGVAIWQRLDGRQTMQEITLGLAEQFNVFAPERVAALISKLNQSGFIHHLEHQEREWQHSSSLFKKMRTWLSQLLEKRFAFPHADQSLSYFYEKYIHYLFTLPGRIMMTTLIILGWMAFIASTPKVISFFSLKHVSLLLMLGLIPLGLIKMMLHELGHAFAVKAYGYDVHYAGIGWSGIKPIVFVDTSDMWLAERRPRMIVNLAGVYVDLVSAGLSSLLIVFIHQPYVQGMLWLFALYTYLGGVQHLNPIQNNDGYYALMDWVEKSQLRHASVWWLMKKFPLSLRYPALFQENKAEIAYWLACILFLIFITFLTWMVQTFIFDVIGIEPANRYFTFALPFLVALLSSMNIIVEIIRQRE